MKPETSKKQKALAELLKDFSIHRTFRMAGHARERIGPALNQHQPNLPGLPRSALTEICGPKSCGKTSLLHTFLAQETGERACALVDAGDCFDPLSGRVCGIELERLLWVRCGGRIGPALKAADILLQGGGFGLVAFDVGGMEPAAVRKIPMMYWYRFRRAVENTPTAFLVIAPAHVTGSCAAMVLAGNPGQAAWSGSRDFKVLQGLSPRFEVKRSEDSNIESGFSLDLRNAAGS